MFVSHWSLSTVPTDSYTQIHKNPHNPTNFKQYELEQGWRSRGFSFSKEFISNKSINNNLLNLVWGEAGLVYWWSGSVPEVLVWLWFLCVDSSVDYQSHICFCIECSHACRHSSLSTSLAMFVISCLLNHQCQLHPSHIVRLCSSPVHSFLWLFSVWLFGF